jgi:GTP-binding protein HflX
MFLSVGKKVRLIDTVGFIRKLPHHLVASFKATLEEASHADILLHIIDVSLPNWIEQAHVVNEVLEGVRVDGDRLVHVLNKMDLVEQDDVAVPSSISRLGRTVRCSAATGEISALRDVIQALCFR